MTSAALLNLMNLLEDEFRNHTEVRIRPVFRSSTRRSPDLDQDYDPKSSSIHKRSGVNIQAGHREYFFPEEWFTGTARTFLYQQIQEIREHLNLS